MGLYTELKLGVELDREAKDVLNILRKMVKGEELPDHLPEHPLFKTDRLHIIFHGCSAYFASAPYAQIVDEYGITTLTTSFNLKNYNQEIEKLLDWLCPYIETQGYIGTYWHEIDREPTPIYKKGNDIYIGKRLLEVENE